MDILSDLEEHLDSMSSAPTLKTTPRLTLEDKGIAGPTGAHFIEELHTPFNIAYVTFTTGSSAYQNITGVTQAEIPDRVAASVKAMGLAGVKPGDRILFTYAPLVNVFPKQALTEYGVTWSFLKASSRDSLLLTLCKEQPGVVIGESSFLRATIESAVKMGLKDQLPKRVIFIAAGTPLDHGLVEAATKVMDSEVHDLYGCQEFGWLSLDGIPLRKDIVLHKFNDDDAHDLIVGGLPTGDRFPVLKQGHNCNPNGKIITYARERGSAELETTIIESTAKGLDTVHRLAKTILRIKARIVRVSPDIVLDAPRTLVRVHPYGRHNDGVLIDGPEATLLIDSLLQSQKEYQSTRKNDPAWLKTR